MNKQTDDLISQLAQDLKPSVVMDSPRAAFLKTLGAGVFALCFLLAITGLRKDLFAGAPSAEFMISMMCLLLALGLSVWVGLKQRIPARPIQNQKMAIAIISALFLVTLTLTADLSFGTPQESVASLGCVAKFFAAALFPMGVFVYQLRKGAVLWRRTSMLFVCSAGVALGLVALLLTCPYEQFVHIVLGHAAPSLALMVSSAFIYKLMFNKI